MVKHATWKVMACLLTSFKVIVQAAAVKQIHILIVDEFLAVPGEMEICGEWTDCEYESGSRRGFSCWRIAESGQRWTCNWTSNGELLAERCFTPIMEYLIKFYLILPCTCCLPLSLLPSLPLSLNWLNALCYVYYWTMVVAIIFVRVAKKTCGRTFFTIAMNKSVASVGTVLWSNESCIVSKV